jgi:hypothetical protein
MTDPHQKWSQAARLCPPQARSGIAFRLFLSKLSVSVSSLRVQSEMGKCRYCGKPAGLFRRQHQECRTRHDEAASKIPAFFVKALQSPMPAEQFCELIDRDVEANFISATERDQLVDRGFSGMVDAALAGGSLTNEADARIDDLRQAFGLSAADLGEAGAALVKARILRALDAGQPDTVKITVDGPLAPRFERGERPLWCFRSARYLTFRSRTHYVGGSAGVSIRVMKGVYYRVGSFHGEPVKMEYLNEEDSGALTITLQNVYFVGTRRALKIPVRKIAATHLYSDGIEILQYGATAKPAVFTMNDAPFAASLVARLQPA